MMQVKLPSELIYFVTSRCHLRCRHCFNWKDLQRNQDLSLAEIDQLASALPNLKTLSISGGEPFLRKDLAEICEIFAKHCELSFVDIPTAGTLIDATIPTVEKILNIKPAFKLAVGVSIDGMESYHDANRGVTGTFAKAVDCCKALLDLKKKYDNLSVNILTTLVQNNKDELLALQEFVAKNLPGVDDLSCVIARGDVKEEHLGKISPDDLACIDRVFQEFNGRRQAPFQRTMVSRLAELRRTALLDNVQPVPCIAGGGIAVVYDDGGVAPCELLPPVGNLRSEPFAAIWQSERMSKARELIAGRKCACTHECFLAPSYMDYLLNHPLTLLRLTGREGLFYLIYHKFSISLIMNRARKVVQRLKQWK